MTTRRDAIALRTGAALLTTAITVTVWAARPAGATALALVITVVFAAIGAVRPDSPAPLAALFTTAAAVAAACAGAHGVIVVPVVAAAAAALWVAHTAFAFAAAVPLGARVHRSAIAAVLGDAAVMLAVSVPVVVLALVAADVLRGSGWRVAGTLAAIAAVAAPAWLVRADAQRRG